jgi:hypothetical protein
MGRLLRKEQVKAVAGEPARSPDVAHEAFPRSFGLSAGIDPEQLRTDILFRLKL